MTATKQQFINDVPADARKMKKSKQWLISMAQIAFVSLLLSGLLAFASPAAKAEAGFKLPSDFLGEFGVVTKPMETIILGILDTIGMTDAATAAANALTDLAVGQVPVISGLEDPFHGNVEDAVAAALADARIALEIMNNVGGPAAQIAVDLLIDTALFAEADFGLTLPTGRIKVYRSGLDVSICMTVIGPFGFRVTTGISNTEQLCGNPAPRMKNDYKTLTIFTDLALGYTHVQTRRFLAPSLEFPFAPMPAPLEAETYIKINGQWVKIRLAGSDPDTIELNAEFEVGLKVGVQAELKLDIGATATLAVKVKPTVAQEVVQGTSDAMMVVVNRQILEALEPGYSVPILDNAGEVLKAGLTYLETFSEAPDYDGELGEVSLKVGVSGGVGIGIWDTGINALSAGYSITTKLPLEAIVQVQSSYLAQVLQIGIDMSDAAQQFALSLLKGEQDAVTIEPLLAEMKTAGIALVQDMLSDLLKLTTKIEMELAFEVSLAGEADGKETNIKVLEQTTILPVGDLSNTLQTEPDAIGNAVEAAGYLMLSAIYPEIDVDWTGLTLGVADGIEFSLMCMGLIPIINVGFSEVPLQDLLELMEQYTDYVRPLLTAVVIGGFQGSFDPLREAVDNAINQIEEVADTAFVTLVRSPRLAFAVGAGANAELGAEGVLKLGVGAKLEGNVKTSLLLLLTNHSEYEEEDGTVLASLSLPVNVSGNLGVSIGEVVEFEVKAGGSFSINLFELSLIHWDGALPPPAGMTVNGFEVIEFEGEIRNDESFTGSGFLALPMGGIVDANFDVDADGNVLSGDWWGGFDLGPLGKLTLAAGPLTNKGIEGIVTLPFFNADFTLTSTGWVYGTFIGDLTIAGLQLSGFELTLEENGFFNGNGFINLGGFQAEAFGQLNEEVGFIGHAYLNLLGSTLEASDLSITDAGATGTFTGDLVLFGHTHSATSLTLIDGGLGLSGTAKMDLFGTAGVDMTLLVHDGVLTATSASNLSVFGTLAQTSSTSLTFSKDGVRVYAVMDDDLLGTINGQVTDVINLIAMDAQKLLSVAKEGVELAQAEVAKLNNDIEAMRLIVTAERDKAVKDATSALIVADQAFALAVDAITVLHNNLAKGISDLSDDLDDAIQGLKDANKEVDGFNTDIANLDKWYNGLAWYEKAGVWAGYQVARLALIGLRDTAKLGLDIAAGFLTGAQNALNAAWDFYDNEMKPLEAAKKLKSDARTAALLTLEAAKWALQNPDTDLRIVGLIFLRDGANTGLALAWLTLSGLEQTVGGAAQIATFINDLGLDLLFRVDHATFEADYQGLGPNSFVDMMANLLYMNQEQEITFKFYFNDPVGSFQTMANSLQPMSSSTGGGGLPADTTAPVADASAPTGWQKNAVTVNLIASDNVGGSGVAGITYYASGAQATLPVSVLGKTAQIVVNTDGTTTISYFATDNDGNSGLTGTITVMVDQTAPTIGIDVPDNGIIIPGDVTITATDNVAGSGVNNITLSASGAETHAAKDFAGSTATINLSVTGKTILTVVVFDKAGNSRTITRTLTVEDTSPPVVTAPADIVDFEATGIESAVPIGTATATDNVGVVSISSDAPDTFPVGITIVTWTASDAAGNTGSATQNVTVADTTPPVVTVPEDVLDYEATAIESVVEIGAATATDLVGVVSLTNDAPDAFPLGTTIVTWTATDVAGNSTIAMQIVRVVDTTVPEIQMPLPEAIYPSKMPILLLPTATDIFPIAEVSISGVDCYKYTKKGRKVSKLEGCIVEVDGSTLTISETGGVMTTIAWTVTAIDNNNNITVESYTMTVANPGKNPEKNDP